MTNKAEAAIKGKIQNNDWEKVKTNEIPMPIKIANLIKAKLPALDFTSPILSAKSLVSKSNPFMPKDST